jgi:hypothetical protein
MTEVIMWFLGLVIFFAVYFIWESWYISRD